MSLQLHSVRQVSRNPVFPKFIFNAKRTENIEEDANYYKEISGLKVNASGKKNIEHGNSNVRKCKFFQNNFLLYQISEFIQFNKIFLHLVILVTSKQFWDQVDEENISRLREDFAYRHDFEMFSYSIENYLSKIGWRLDS